MVVLTKQMIRKAWIRNEDFTMGKIVILERESGNGFDVDMSYILSGNSKVRDITGNVDTALTVVTSVV
jgi:hypothetical protein